MAAAPSPSSSVIKWVEGLRGIASILVLATHLSRAWDFELFYPSDSPDASPRFLQLPILRVPAQGRIGVPIFAFLTGFVCSIQPLRRAYAQGHRHAALTSIAHSAFRRTPRLVLPASIATAISFAMSLLGGYKSATRCDSFWVRFDAPSVLPSFGLEVRRLFHTLLTTWTNTDNPYDRHQWAMRPLLIGAFQVYICLAVTIGMRFRYRIVFHVLLMTYWWLNREPFTETFGGPIALGTLLGELSLHQPTQNFITAHRRVLSLAVSPLIMLVGLWIGSYPQEHEDWEPWSLWLHQTFVNLDAPDGEKGSLLVPEGTIAQRRFSSLAVQMCAVAIFLSPVLREALSNKRLQWLGKHSFAVYLLHGTLLRTVGVWIIYGISGEPWQQAGIGEDGEPEEQRWLAPRGRTHVYTSVLVFIVLTYAAAWAWMRYVDSACARATAWLERKVFDEEDTQSTAEKGQNGSAVRIE